MTLLIARAQLLKPLQMVASAVERRHSLPILSHVLMTVKGQRLSLTGTDLEVELVARIPLEEPAEDIAFTVPAKKMLDICKALPDASEIQILCDGTKITVKAGRSRYTLSGLNPEEYPKFDEGPGALEFSLAPKLLRKLLGLTSFSMAQQDVRYYLNGLLFWVQGNNIRAVATDGHRLATHEVETKIVEQSEQQVILPRKAVLELGRLLADEEQELGVVLGENHMRMISPQYSFSAKLIEGKFPDYRQVLPKRQKLQATVSKDKLKEVLQRASVLLTDRFRGISITFSPNTLQIKARNQESEEAEEEIEIQYDGPEVKIGFNCAYLLEYLGIIKSAEIQISFSDPDTSVLLEPLSDTEGGLYVVMPMRL